MWYYSLCYSANVLAYVYFANKNFMTSDGYCSIVANTISFQYVIEFFCPEHAWIKHHSNVRQQKNCQVQARIPKQETNKINKKRNSNEKMGLKMMHLCILLYYVLQVLRHIFTSFLYVVCIISDVFSPTYRSRQC